MKKIKTTLASQCNNNNNYNNYNNNTNNVPVSINNY